MTLALTSALCAIRGVDLYAAACVMLNIVLFASFHIIVQSMAPHSLNPAAVSSLICMCGSVRLELWMVIIALTFSALVRVPLM